MQVYTYDVYLKLQTMSTELSEMILKRKEGYHCQLADKLSEPETSAVQKDAGLF